MTNLFDQWETWTIIYVVSAVIFAHFFKSSNRNMKDAGSLTIILELFTAIFAIFLIPFFKWNLPSNKNIYLTLLLVTIIYAVTDRLNIEARYGLDPSIFSMLKQLSTVFLILFGITFLKEEIVFKKILGALIIIIGNFVLTFDKGKIKFNKYFIMCVISNFLFAVAMLINVGISNNFNLAFYTICTVSIPALFISIYEKKNITKLKNELNNLDKPKLLISSFFWCMMLISSVKAYQLGSVSVVAPLFALTSIINAIIEYIFNKNKNKFIQKLIASILVILGVILIKI